MGPNPGWSDLLPDILLRMDERRGGQSPRRGALYRLKQSLPHHWVRPALNALPSQMNERLVQLWSRRMFDWPRTRYFPMPMDEAGYVRVNLRGRERLGIVAAGREYDAVCREVEDLVASLRDEATGGSIAERAVWAWRDADPGAACRQLMPDLIFPWAGPTAATTRRLVSTLLPDFRFDLPGRLPSGRSGNHNGQGWFIAAGPGLARGMHSGVHHVVDLLPTIRRYLGLDPDPRLPGRPIAELAGK
jgi:predicted AlkP superfamily phosphohydrolase/phosphomutase